MARKNTKTTQGKEPDMVVPVDEYFVGSWSPGPEGANTPPTQVHISFDFPDIATFVVRLKSRRAVDEMIATLIEHRDYTWPQEKGTE